jgi:hypothetical protein
MPQNTEKYFYINRVGLLRGSWALEKFEKDAERHHMEDQPGKLAALRLTEYYELLDRLERGGIPIPTLTSANGSNGHHSPAAQQEAPTTTGNGGRKRRPLQEEDQEDATATPAPGQQDPDAALDESADYWTNL